MTANILSITKIDKVITPNGWDIDLETEETKIVSKDLKFDDNYEYILRY